MRMPAGNPSTDPASNGPAGLPVPEPRPTAAKSLGRRRAVLTGVVGAAGAAAVLSGLSAAPAEAATGVTDWIIITDYGADPTGTKDSATAIANAIAAAPSGGVVYMPAGIFLIESPIVLQKGVTLVGAHGATASGDDATQFSGTVIRVGSNFTNSTWSAYATAAILCLDQKPGTQGSASTLGIRLRDFWIDGSSSPASVDGITCYGPVSSWQAERIGAYKTTGNAFSFISADGGNPDGQHLYSCLAQHCKGEGFTGQMLDATLVDCHAQGCGSNGIHLIGGNTRFFGCRSDLNGGHGWYLDHSGAGDGDSDGIVLDGCGTQGNNHNGVYITNSSGSPSGSGWHDPILIAGCSFGEDGQDGTWSSGSISGGDGLGWAGIHIEGENHVHISNTLIAQGTLAITAGSPQYGIRTGTIGSAKPISITVSGGRIEASGTNGELINDAALVQGDFKISPETVGALGYQSDTTYSRQGSATLSGGSASVSTPWASSVSRVFLSTLGAGGSQGFLSVTRSAGSFTINSTSSSDTSNVAWMLTTA